MIENFFTTEQVANILQVHPFTILKFIREGKLQGVKLGRVYRIKESAVQKFLEDRSVTSQLRATEGGEQHFSSPAAQPVSDKNRPSATIHAHYSVDQKNSEEKQQYFQL
ncbi:helix-turn-helix domain-containing protein [Candidatus Peregrinibacteria bacterium]|nr:helix-turn-helix domain-containing protein [Candidatus Peregrinibacteria bacterium]